ncbi:MAG: hypothetical protein II938_02260 [Alphaproteobacteria bacterium]|nr:hypothetical protein [Alphaproteobacteria bacterium]
MKETFKNLLDLEKPVLTEKLAPKLAPFAKLIYFVGLVLMALFAIRLIAALLNGENFSIFLFDLLMLVAEFAVVRMFCEYLAASAPKAKK